MNQRNFLIGLALIFILGIGLSQEAAAQEGGSQFGVLWGLSVPDAENVNPHKIFGVKGAARITSTFGLGGYYLDSGSERGTGGVPFDYSLHGVEATWHVPSGSGDTYFGGRFGLSKVRTDVNTVDTLLSPYHYGFVVGYDYFLTGAFGVGFEGSLVYVESSSTERNTVRSEHDAFSIMNFLLSFQFRL